MSEHDATRRAFLVRAVVVGAGSVAGAGLVPDASANVLEQHQDAHATTPETHKTTVQHHTFFNAREAAAITAFTERLMPGAPGKPGATDAGVLNYVDLALSGAYRDLQDFYRSGLAQLDVYCRETYKQPFVELDGQRQDAVITAIEQGKATAFTWPTAQAFFNTVRTHTVEGMFADPVYGGNKDFAGWRLVGFPGAQLAYTASDLQKNEAFTRVPRTGLQQAESANPARKG